MKRTHPIRSATGCSNPPDRRLQARQSHRHGAADPKSRQRRLGPGSFAAEYYAQRASAGLIVAEATQISAQAQGYADTPGCYTDEQVRGWKKVTDAVHAKGGVIAVQLWHTGRVSHTSFQKDGQAPVGPSAIRANTKTFVAGQGFVDARRLARSNWTKSPDRRRLPLCVDPRHRGGVRRRRTTGAHGYLLDAFLRDGTNKRTDAYGGCIENRSRLLPRSRQGLCGRNRGQPLGRADITGIHHWRLARQRIAGALQSRRRKP